MHNHKSFCSVRNDTFPMDPKAEWRNSAHQLEAVHKTGLAKEASRNSEESDR